ncbi:MAG: DUF4905 domain-containing protein [Sphingobacteriaceae bacterium]|nr:MAG: DUF4905 domain-containing protein [Sphingobacteriaceae bacterium]
MRIDFKLITEHLFNGVIWKMEVDTSQELLFVETRNAENHTAAFSSLSLKTGKNHFTELLSEEKWLIGIAGGRNGMLFLHCYSSEQSPEHKAVIALDAFTGKQVWADYNLSAETFTTSGLLVTDQRFQTKKTVLLDYKTGKILQKPNELYEDFQQITQPLMLRLPPKNLTDLIADEIVGEISLVNYNPYLIISLHTQKNGALQQQLFILKNDEIVYQDLLNEQIQKLQPEAFMVVKNRLVYLKNKIILKVLNLS